MRYAKIAFYLVGAGAMLVMNWHIVDILSQHNDFFAIVVSLSMTANALNLVSMATDTLASKS